jgi:hypothetical protein
LESACLKILSPRGRTGGQGSTFPCRVDILVVLVDVDRTVGSWVPDGKGTVDRLHQLAARGWRPQDCGRIDAYSGRIERWVVLAAELLAAAPRVFLEAPCPRCGAKFSYHRNADGERVRTRALRVSEDGCVCGSCGAFWSPDDSTGSPGCWGVRRCPHETSSSFIHRQ